jgi:hypothetical protein
VHFGDQYVRTKNMKTKLLFLLVAALGSLLLAIQTTRAQGTKFTYQGHLTDGGTPANGTYDLTFQLWNAPGGGAQTGSTLTNNSVVISNGLFTAALDFGAVFNGTSYWLQLAVRTNGAGSFTDVSPRQELTPAPYAIFAEAAPIGDGTVTSAKILDGTISSSDLGPNSVNSGHIIDGQVANADLANNAVNSAKVLDGSLVGADLANNTVGSDQLADIIALGRSNVLGRLDVFYANTASNQPAITLFGSGSQISTYGSDGLEQIRLWGAGWGEILLHDNSAANNITAQLVAHEDFLGLGIPGGALKLMQGTTNRIYIKGGASGGTMTLYQNDGGTGISLDGDSGGAGYIDIRSTNGSARVVLDGDAGDGGGLITVRNGNGNNRINLDGSSTDLGGEISVYDGSGTETVELKGAVSTSLGGSMYLRQADGTVGVELLSEGYAGDGGFVSVKNAAGTEKIELDGDDGDGAPAVRLRNAAGTVTITFDADVGGDGRVTTQELTITGGSDLSEQFDINPLATELQPGMVVCIDSEHPGELVSSTRPYDRTVAGVISGAGGIKTGMMMGQVGTQADGKHPVALTGRVYVLADASKGRIKPGDLLTTSSTPGHAMKVANHTKAQGAILGKAMTGLSQGKGMVLVLVSLQ